MKSPLLFSGLLPWVLAAGGLYLLLRPATGGRNWRGISGRIVLRPGIPYRIESVYPVSINVAALQSALSPGVDPADQRTAALPDGLHLWYPHTPQNLEPIDLGKTIPGILGAPMTVRSVTRLDGKDWNSDP